MLEIEAQGFDGQDGMPTAAEVERLSRQAFAALGIERGHAAVVAVDEDKIRQLNRHHRGKDRPTDVLSFPLDGVAPDATPEVELGDVFICQEHCSDVVEAVVHGVLHLGGMDHETDEGQMLALQAEILRWERG